MTIKETPNIITAVLKVTATAEFFDDDASEETVRYVIEQCLEDAGFDVDVALLKEQEVVKPKKVKGYRPPIYTLYEYECEECKTPMMDKQPFCMGCGKAVKWNG